MYWKYHIEADDLLRFWYEATDGARHKAEGTCLGLIAPEDMDATVEHSTEEIDFGEWKVRINSGGIRVDVPIEDVTDRKKSEDRDTDLPGMGEDILRWGGGIKQNDHDVGDIADHHNPHKGSL